MRQLWLARPPGNGGRLQALAPSPAALSLAQLQLRRRTCPATLPVCRKATVAAGGGGTAGFGAGEPTCRDVSALDFGDSEAAYSSLTQTDLLRAIAVFTVCGISPLVTHAERLLSVANRVLGPSAVAAIIRPTFFKHFCVGEDVADIAPVLARLRAHGIGGILDYAAEADLPEPLAADAAGGEIDPRRITFATHGVSTPPVYSARVYHYTDERQCDQNAAIFAEAILAVRDTSPDGFAAIKMTALGNPALLERWSTALLEVERLYGRLVEITSDGDEALAATRLETGLDWPTFLDGYRQLFVVPDELELKRVFDRHARVDDDQADASGTAIPRLGALDWCANLDMGAMASLSAHCHTPGRFFSATLDEGEQALVRRMAERVEELAALAHRCVEGKHRKRT